MSGCNVPETATAAQLVDASSPAYHRITLALNPRDAATRPTLPNPTYAPSRVVDRVRTRLVAAAAAALAASGQPNASFVEYGADLGLVALPLLRMGYRAHLVQPLPENARLLRASLCLNNYTAVATLHGPLALGDGGASSVCMAIAHGGERSLRSLYATPASACPRDGFRVRSRTLDDVIDCSRSGAVSVLRIDAAGAELDVLRGARRVLAECRPRAVLLEDSGRSGRGRSNSLAVKYLLQRGYYVHEQIGEGGIEDRVHLRLRGANARRRSAKLWCCSEAIKTCC